MREKLALCRRLSKLFNYLKINIIVVLGKGDINAKNGYGI